MTGVQTCALPIFFGLYDVTKIGKYEFRRNIIKPGDMGRRVLYVVGPKELTTDLRVIDEVNFLDGMPAFLLAVKK